MKARFVITLLAIAVLCASAMAQENTSSYWLNKGNESRERAINETQNQTAKNFLLQEALNAYDKAIEIDPNVASAWFNKGEIFADFLGRFDEALVCINKSIEINPQFADAWYLKGKGLTVFGNYGEALKAYNESLRINPKSAEVWYWKASVSS